RSPGRHLQPWRCQPDASVTGHADLCSAPLLPFGVAATSLLLMPITIPALHHLSIRISTLGPSQLTLVPSHGHGAPHVPAPLRGHQNGGASVHESGRRRPPERRQASLRPTVDR